MHEGKKGTQTQGKFQQGNRQGTDVQIQRYTIQGKNLTKWTDAPYDVRLRSLYQTIQSWSKSKLSVCKFPLDTKPNNLTKNLKRDNNHKKGSAADTQNLVFTFFPFSNVFSANLFKKFSHGTNSQIQQCSVKSYLI